MSTRQMAREERVEFASFLEGLTPEQWDSPTLCDKWHSAHPANRASMLEFFGAQHERAQASH
jgi:hypothetical protein